MTGMPIRVVSIPQPAAVSLAAADVESTVLVAANPVAYRLALLIAEAIKQKLKLTKYNVYVRRQVPHGVPWLEICACKEGMPAISNEWSVCMMESRFITENTEQRSALANDIASQFKMVLGPH